MLDAEYNTSGLNNLEFRRGKMEDVLSTLTIPDVVVLDPPRIGCKPQVLEVMIQWSPRRLVYVACDPETMSRDLNILVQGGFYVESIEPIDMFPQTYHVESVTVLLRQQSR